jgi:diguanylate cyclase (GGDEF)-like protein
MIIYIIDDNETNLDLFETIVRKVDGALEPVCFTDPLEALQVCERRMPDAVAVDYIMPGLDGHEFVRRFRVLPGAEAIPIIMITAATERQVRRTALDLGVSDFLTKPLDPFEARARLKTIVALRERERSLQLGLVIANAANHAGSVTDIFNLALAEICGFTGWEAGAAFSVDDGSLRPISAWHGAPVDAAEVLRRVAELIPPPASPAGRVVATGEAQWTDDLTGTSFCPQQVAATCGFRASCAFPVLVGAEVAAVLQFFTAADPKLDESRLGLLAQVGMQLGRAIERARAKQLLEFNASHDPLTQLPNRMFFTERLQQAVTAYRRDSSASFAVLFIDLDRFKIINDSLGHLAGDDLLVQVATRMKACVRRSDTLVYGEAADLGESRVLARLGGDEFTILLDRIEEPSDVLRVANRIQEALQRPFSIAGQEVYMGASIGITLGSIGYESGAAVLRDADLAMYRAKSLGKGRTEIFDQTMHDAAMARLTLEADLRRGLRNQEFVLHYQPIVDLATRQVAGFEALVRWQVPDGQVIPPASFIQVAEETGLIVFLGAWVLREACRQLHAWNAEFPDRKPLTISVNVSPREFIEKDFVDQVERILLETGVDAKHVCIEITESATMGDPECAVQILSRLRALGMQLSVDDFGTGYSSLSYLHRFPLDVLKIDKSFVTNIVHESESRDVINSIVTLARSMGLAVVAEGAEHEGQIEVLKMLGCDLGQGFVFHRPLDAPAAMALLRTRGQARPREHANQSYAGNWVTG